MQYLYIWSTVALGNSNSLIQGIVFSHSIITYYVPANQKLWNGNYQIGHIKSNLWLGYLVLSSKLHKNLR